MYPTEAWFGYVVRTKQNIIFSVFNTNDANTSDVQVSLYSYESSATE